MRRLEAKLQVTAVAESISINASALSLQTDRADVNNQISKSQVQNLPFAGNQGRNFQNL